MQKVEGEPLTREQKRVVQTTWEQVVPIADQAAGLFYGRLFKLDPGLRALFRSTDFEEQGKKLMQSLTVVVRGLDRMEQIVPAVQSLGRRHVDYGVRADHYDTVGAALLWTLEQGLGESFTVEVRDAWAAAYDAIARVMRGAAYSTAATRSN